MKSLGFFITIKSSFPECSLSSPVDWTIHESTILPLQTSLSLLFLYTLVYKILYLLISTILFAFFLLSGIFFPATHFQNLLSLKCSNPVSPPPESSSYPPASHNHCSSKLPQALIASFRSQVKCHFKREAIPKVTL